MRPSSKASQKFIALLVCCVLVLAACGGADTALDNETEANLSNTSGITVVTNARVYTIDADRSWAEAFAYDAAGVILAVGFREEVLAAIEGQSFASIDAGGNMVLPGFQDSHVHVPEAGLNQSVCFFEAGLSISDYELLAVECAEEQTDDEWVRAAGPSLFEFRDADELPIAVLDRAIPDRPAIVLDGLGHAVWTNTLGLEAAGIGSDDPNPQGGIFHRDLNTGELTGLLLEDAQQLVRNAAAPNTDTVYDGLLLAFETLAENGVTTVSDAGGYWAQNHPAAWERARDSGTLSVRGHNSLYLYPDLPMQDQLAEFEKRFVSDPNDLLSFDTAKIYADGILDLGTALTIDPYLRPIDRNYPSGFSYFQPDVLTTYVNELHQLGFRMSFHAIGDQANRMALDSIEAIDDDPESIASRRHRTTHTYLVHPDDLPRFERLGVVADFQVGVDSTHPEYHDFMSAFIGDKAFDLLPVAAVLATGADVSLSSDWDADELSPVGILQRSLTRTTNALPDLETAISMITINAAYAMGHDDRTGSIEVGKFADYVILDQNLFELAVNQIDATRVLLTVMGGDETYRSSRFDG